MQRVVITAGSAAGHSPLCRGPAARGAAAASPGRCRRLGAVVLLIGAAWTLSAGDWPQWGGSAHRNMYSPERGLPAGFSPGTINPGTEEYDVTSGRNTRWIVKLGTQSYGNCTVSGGRVFVGTNNDHPRDPRHSGDRSILLCLDEATGELVWQLVIPKRASGQVNDWEYLGLLSSPTVEGDRVYVVTSRCEVMCLDTKGLADGNDGPYTLEGQYAAGPGKPPIAPGPKDADILWVYDMMDELGVFPHNASNGAVLLVGDTLFTSTANGHDWTHANVPAPFAPSLVALDKRTGQLVAEDDARIGPRIFHGQWSSPSSGVVNGRPLVFFGGGDGFLYAFETAPVKTADGNRLKTVWKFDCNPPEYKTRNGRPIKYPDAEGPSEVNATPVFYRNRVYASIGQDPEYGEGVGRLVCVDATKTGDITGSGLVWDFKGLQRSMSTVSIDPATGLLFVADFSGYVRCLEADTGRVHWTHDMKAHVWGSTLVADGRAYVGDEDGDFVVLAATRDLKVLSEVNLDAPVYSTPVAANGVLYVGSQTHLFAFRDAAALRKLNR
ncbi:MAG: PQQ-binding-like beta-propeller repeat protein [Verrucomicrobia bacterium]|nr:PQQ-binding-like beta-propeller repeat protein [Verrucomicrobiota bacterium]